MKMGTRTLFEIVFVFLTATGCSNNLFKGASTGDHDENLLVDAKAAINSFNYQSAIDIVTLQMSANGRAQTNAKEVLASAYAGKCGLNFVSFLEKLSTANSGTGLGLMVAPYVGVAVDPDSCLLALNTLETIGASASRTANENAFAAVVGMSLLGGQVRAAVDLAPVNGDGTVDSAICSMTNAQLDNAILGMGHLIINFSFLSVQQIGAGSQTAINDLINVCASMGLPSCTVTDPTQITQPLRDTMKDLINTDDYGIGLVHSGGNPVTVAGACP